MPKSESAETLLKRLQKIERAQGRLGDITTRIRVQAETLAELLKVAQAFVNEKSASKPASRPRSAASSKKAASSKRSVRNATVAPATAKRATAARAARPPEPAAATTKRRAPRKVASA